MSNGYIRHPRIAIKKFQNSNFTFANIPGSLESFTHSGPKLIYKLSSGQYYEVKEKIDELLKKEGHILITENLAIPKLAKIV